MSEEVKAAEAPVAAMGIADLKAVVILVLDAIAVGAEVVKDGKVSITDLPLLLKLVPDLLPAVSGLTKVPAELADLSDDEATELLSAVVAKLGLADEKTKEIAQASLKVVSGLAALVQALVK